MATAEKLDLKKKLPDLYNPSTKGFVTVKVPKFQFLMVDGSGDPNTAKAYTDAIQALFSASYTLKFMLKKRGGPDYGVMPLEGLWWSPNPGEFNLGNKDEWSWTAMIMQPDFVTEAQMQEAIAEAAKKKDLPSAGKLRLEAFEEGKSAQIMYVGAYADEAPTILRLHEYIAAQGGKLRGKHHEIYLGDPRRTDPSKLKTVIRQPFE